MNGFKYKYNDYGEISLISGGMGSRFNSAISQMPTATQVATESMISLPTAIIEQQVNKSYDNYRNK